MAKTPNSSASSYLTVAEFLKRCDWRFVADMVSDAGVRGTQGSLTNDVNLAAVLDTASGELEAACLRGQRYDPLDLAALANPAGAGGVSQKFMFDTLTNLAIGVLYKRRPDKGEPPDCYNRALGVLQALATGERIFSFAETQAAGLPSHAVEVANDVEHRQLTVVQMGRFFGPRGNELNG